MDLTPLMKPKSIAVVGASPRMNRATRVITNLQRFGYAALLRGARGRRPADVAALAEALVGLAVLAAAHRDRLRALDLNPLIVLDEGGGVVAVDWLIELA